MPKIKFIKFFQELNFIQIIQKDKIKSLNILEKSIVYKYIKFGFLSNFGFQKIVIQLII